MKILILGLVCIGLVWTGRHAQAWSHKEHIQLTRIAVARLIADPQTPPRMRQWLEQTMPGIPDLAGEREFLLTGRVGPRPGGYDGMLHWVYTPDVLADTDRKTRIEPFGVRERLMHFIDLELFVPGDKKRGYRHDLSGKPGFDDVPRDHTDPRFQQAGVLPLRIEQCYRELVRAIREDRLHAPTIEEQQGKTATYWAGYLAHYLADNTQPHHATLDYKSQSYFANPRKAPNVHAEMEYRMVDDEKQDFPELRAEYWSLFERELARKHDPIATTDPFRASLEVSFLSYDALPLIGVAAMKAAGQGGSPEAPRGDISGAFDTEAFLRHRGQFAGREMSVMELKARQTAWAVFRIEKTLRQAWREATGE